VVATVAVVLLIDVMDDIMVESPGFVLWFFTHQSAPIAITSTATTSHPAPLLTPEGGFRRVKLFR
jgi:hypothetical protein